MAEVTGMGLIVQRWESADDRDRQLAHLLHLYITTIHVFNPPGFSPRRYFNRFPLCLSHDKGESASMRHALTNTHRRAAG